MDRIFEAIEEWMRNLLTGMVSSNLTTMYTDVNEKTGQIAAQVGQTPQGWNGNVFSMIQNLSDSVIVPIAGMIITFVLCYELISMLTEKNNMHDIDTWMFFKYFFKMWVAVWIVSHTFTITMAVFDVGQNVVSRAAGVISSDTAINIDTMITTMETAMESMEIGELVILALETMLVSLCMKVISVFISEVPFHFSYDEVLRTGLSTKDYIAPTSFVFKNGKDFQMGGTIGAVSYLQILAPELTDKMLAEFLEMDSNLMVNFHIQSIDQMKAIKLVKSKVTDINRMKIEEQKKAVRAGYDMDIIPSDLNTYGGEAKRLLEDLQSRNERMFLVTALFLNTAETKQELENVVFQTAGIAQKYNCALKRLDYQQEQGLMSCLPLAMNLVPIKRALTTTSTAIFVPFTTQELFMGGESIYYGLNALSNNLIMADRKKLKNPNGLILGTPGAGKSFAAKREITNAFIVTKDDIIVCDPEGEYYPLFRAFHGQVIRISPTSHDYINPMDINLDYADDDDPLSLKSDFILSLCELVVGGKNGLEPVEKTVIDRCVRLVYQDFLSDPVPEKMPILEDLYNLLREQKEQEAQRLATALEIYVNGSLKVFNHRTNVELSNRMVCFDIKDLGKQLKKLGMLIVQDQVWNRVTINRSANKSTRYYIDEFHLLLKEEQTAAYSVEIWKRFRKWGGIPTGITQNVKDLLASREIENIFENSDFILMLNQASGDRQILAKQLNISPHQLSYVTNSGEGEGLVFYGSTIIPFKDKFDNSLMLYALMTSKPDEVEKRKKLGIGERDD